MIYLKKLIIYLIRGYQVTPLHSHSMCRFTPTCSEYMIEALEAYGLWKGLIIGIKEYLNVIHLVNLVTMNLKRKGKIYEKIFLLILSLFLLTGCSLKKDNLESATIYTTIYPIKYLTEFLYKDYATIESIYPAGADVTTYELTDKQIKKLC